MHLSGRHVRRLIRSLQETEAETLSFWTLKRSGNLPKHLIEIQKRRKRLASRHAPPPNTTLMGAMLPISPRLFHSLLFAVISLPHYTVSPKTVEAKQ